MLDAPLYGGQIVARINDLTAHPGIGDGRLQPVLLDWSGLNSPPLSLVIKRSLVRQPRIRAWVDFIAEQAQHLASSGCRPACRRCSRQNGRTGGRSGC